MGSDIPLCVCNFLFGNTLRFQKSWKISTESSHIPSIQVLLMFTTNTALEQFWKAGSYLWHNTSNYRTYSDVGHFPTMPLPPDPRCVWLPWLLCPPPSVLGLQCLPVYCDLDTFAGHRSALLLNAPWFGRVWCFLWIRMKSYILARGDVSSGIVSGTTRHPSVSWPVTLTLMPG